MSHTRIDRPPREASRATLPGGAATISKRRLTLTVMFEWFARGIGVALGVVVAAVLTRYLGPSRFGDLSLGFLLVSMTQNAADFGFKQMAVREASARPEQRHHIAGTYVALRGILGVGLFAIVAGLGLLLGRDDATQLAVVIMGASLLLSFFGAAGFLLQVRLRNDLFALTVLVQSVVWLAIVVVAAELDLSLPAVALGFLLMSTIHVGLTFYLAQRLVPFHYELDRAWLRRLLRISLALVVAGIATALLSRIDSVIVYALAGAYDGGLYAAGLRVFEQLQILPVAVVSLIAPLLASWHAVDPGRLTRAYRRIERYLLIVTLAAGIGGALVAEPLAVFLFGDRFEGVGPLLAVMLVAFVFQSVSYLQSAVCVAMGRTVVLSVILIAGLLADVAVNLILVPHYGAMAAAWAMLGTRVLIVVATYAYLAPRLKVGPPLFLLARLVPPVAALTLSVVLLEDTSVPLAILVAGSAYGVACLLTGGFTRAEIRGLFGAEEVVRI